MTADWSGIPDDALREAAETAHRRADTETCSEAKRELLRYMGNDMGTELARRAIAARERAKDTTVEHLDHTMRTLRDGEWI